MPTPEPPPPLTDKQRELLERWADELSETSYSDALLAALARLSHLEAKAAGPAPGEGVGDGR